MSNISMKWFILNPAVEISSLEYVSVSISRDALNMHLFTFRLSVQCLCCLLINLLIDLMKLFTLKCVKFLSLIKMKRH